MPIYKRPEDAKGGLHTLLLRAVPENEHGNKTILHLSELMGLHRWSINKWVRSNKISPNRVLQLIEVSRITGYTKSGKPIKGEPRVSREDFDPYIYNV